MKQISEELDKAIKEVINEAECVVDSNGKRQIDIDSLRDALTKMYSVSTGESLEALGLVARESKPGGISHGG